LPGVLARLSFDLVGEDGFRPTSAGHPPIDGTRLSSAYLQLETGRVHWDGEEMACAYGIKGLTMLIALGPRD
jgi:hypothetical protein